MQCSMYISLPFPPPIWILNCGSTARSQQTTVPDKRHVTSVLVAKALLPLYPTINIQEVMKDKGQVLFRLYSNGGQIAW